MTVRLVLVAAALAGQMGCAVPEPEVICEEGYGFSRPPTLQCDAAVRAAIDALADDHRRITGITFRYGFYCPPGQGCPPPSDDGGVVFFEFARGDPVYVDVFYQAGHILVRAGPLPGSP